MSDPLQEIIAPVLKPNGDTQGFNLRNYQFDPGIDIAAFEISFVDLSHTQNEKDYLRIELFDNVEPTQSIDELVVVNATNFNGYDREEIKSEGTTMIRLTTLPYFTQIKEYTNDFFICDANTNGVGEDGTVQQVESFAGMSGSPVFKVTLKGSTCRWIGIMTNGDPEAGQFWVLDYRVVIDFLDQRYFHIDQGFEDPE
ncbi:hypothetical protein [Brevibacillus brevis]|uniref:hypothetical protein n=1 Tax=Brevibacillus brevis TaxID=1393 RepID=UPI000D1145D8|nr:hypothetical protein [Brevibacillus brevis]PSJ67849.1 hypothetical protein C7J99_18720 [Brevibacillus brevis]RED22893.1 hypothetical protein DES34_116102 [Brevibacillus brevis]GEC91333.1 hypothetical protein BBR01nite_36640 [Brevibacillus brevis]VEF87766.1 Uncharacterised protein [Brevibacillus brevis]